MDEIIQSEIYGPITIIDWLEDRGRFSRFTTDEKKYGFDSIWICLDCFKIEDECTCIEDEEGTDW